MKSVEIYILSGFLGSGKTTILERLLEKEKEDGRNVAVIMNELGEISIDSDSVPKDTPLKELLNGCVCCTLSDQLEVQISELLGAYDLDVIYIETTGVAHPVEVLDSCLSPLLADKVSIHSIITLVDAAGWLGRKKFKLPLQKLMAEQVKHADVIVLNKIDRISKESLETVERELHQINPIGKIIPTTFANFELSELQHEERKETAGHEEAHVIEHLHMKTYVHTFSHPINEKLFNDFLKTIPDNIYRIKGYIHFSGKPETFLFQYAYGMPIHTVSGLQRKDILVLIGDGINHSSLQEALNTLEKESIGREN